MTAINSVINKAQVSLDRATRRMSELASQMTTGSKINKPEDDAVSWALSARANEQFASIQAVNASISAGATSIRTADASMEAIGDLINHMKGILDSIVKVYPPYPTGSTERAELLQQFNGIRNQIDKLTIPAEDFGARKLLADPAMFADDGDLQITFTQTGEQFAIASQPAHTGVEGLDIPELPAETTTDQEIYDAIINLGQAEERLSHKRMSLAADANAITPQKTINSSMAEEARGAAQRLGEANMYEAAAELQSLEIRVSLVYEAVGMSITNSGKLASLLG